MIEREDTIETALEDGYRDEARCYTQALRLAEEIPLALGRGERIDGCLEQLQALFQKIACVEASLRPLEKRSKQAHGGGRPSWQEAKEDVVALLEKLLHSIRQGEREAIAQRDTLILPVDLGIRVRRMQEAYGHGA